MTDYPKKDSFQNYGELRNYSRQMQTPPVWRQTNRLGYVPSDNKFLTQQAKNIMVNSDGTAGGYDYLVNNGNPLATTGSSNYGYFNLKATEELVKSMNQNVG